MRLAGFSDELQPFLAMEVMERGHALARGGADVVQLCVGEPDGAAPAEVVAEAARALGAGETHYTESRGLYALCCAIAEDCRVRRGIAVTPEQVIVTTGTSAALYMVMRLLLEPGDEILIPSPHYPCHANMALTCGARPVFVQTHAADGYAIDPAQVRKAVTPRTRALVLCSPSNPTGAVQPEAVVRELAQLGLPILSDEIYDGLLFDDARVCSPLGMNDDCFVFDGFSKRYAMTGFRLGYTIVPQACVRALVSMQQNLHICASEFAQRAAIVALTHGGPYVERMRGVYAERRHLLLDGLRALGFGIPRAPHGAFYILADAAAFGTDSLALALDLLERTHVAIAPGRDFGPFAEGHLRFSYATSEARIALGLERLKGALR